VHDHTIIVARGLFGHFIVDHILKHQFRRARKLNSKITGAYNEGEIAKTGFAQSPQVSQLDLVPDPATAAMAAGGIYPLTRVAYWGPNTGKVEDAVSKALNAIFLGSSSVADALGQAQTDAQAALSGQ